MGGIAGCWLGHHAFAAEAGLAAFAPSGFATSNASTFDSAVVGSDVRIGDIRGFIDAIGAPASADRAFVLSPSIGIEELVTDNVSQLARPRRADLVTSFLPQLTLSGQTSRIEANITYAPRIELYARTSQQNQIVQDFNGEALLTAISDTLFLRLRGYGAQQSSSANPSQSALPYYSAQNRNDVLSLEASPYLSHRFGGYGTAVLGYTMTYSSQSGDAPVSARSLLTNALLSSAGPNALLANATTRSKEEYATFKTGENFGRFSDALTLDATQYSSSGTSVLRHAHRTTAVDSFGYGLTRAVALLGSLGYEDIRYAGPPAIVIKDAVWSGGVRLTPNVDSSILASYGHKDGFNAFTFNASYALTSRLRIYASYSEGLTSSMQELQDNINNSTVDGFGNTVDTGTGAPTLITDQVLGPQNTLYRLKRFSGTAVSVYDRDVLSLTLEQETRRLVASAPGVPGFSDRGVSGAFSWRHDLTADLSATATIRYGRASGQGSGAQSSDTVGITFRTRYAISPTLATTFEYFFVNKMASAGGRLAISGLLGQSFSQNAVIIGLHKAL